MPAAMQGPDGLLVWLIVPVKPLEEGKSRLAPALDAAARAALSRRWLNALLATAQASARFAGIGVVSRDPAVLALATTYGATAIQEAGDDLNSALEQARRVAVQAGAEALLVLPSDLPLVTAEDLTTLVTLAATGAGMVIAPSHDGGTNALLLRPPNAIPYAFGDESFERHRALAAAAGLPCRVVHSPTLAWDVDSPEDLLVTGAS
ncbi:MAG TPA: 2-phospho-L-lactate guanylyltransferase [Caldilineaceae bacterium]|nr:2-phospho-L-lactate guanylyltransferase [Caldilineaceae bacterium]